MPIGLEEFLKTATQEQKQLLLDLHDLAEKEQKLAEKINKIHSSTNSWPGIYGDGITLTLCEDEDDANIISMEPKRELIKVRNKIAELLKKAVSDLKMGNVGIIQRQYKNYVTN